MASRVPVLDPEMLWDRRMRGKRVSGPGGAAGAGEMGSVLRNRDPARQDGSRAVLLSAPGEGRKEMGEKKVYIFCALRYNKEQGSVRNGKRSVY